MKTLKATEKQKEFLNKLIKEIEILRDGGTNDSYFYANVEKFAMCKLEMLSIKQSLELADALDKILTITRGLKK